MRYLILQFFFYGVDESKLGHGDGSWIYGIYHPDC
jgi:hypothetical protein